MAFLPTFRYSLGGAEMPISPGSSLWESPLPMNRHHFQESDTDNTGHAGLTHGDYFTAVRRFLETERFHLISAAFDPEKRDPVSDIQICLMKHGEFYHPARVRVASTNRHRSFVLNVALSRSGRGVIDAEVSALERLGNLTGSSFVPKVYGKGSVEIGSDLTADMFLGEWFEGYHEFHLSRRPSDGAQTLCVWGENDIPRYLAPEEAYLIYHQATRILTLYFNMISTEHISHWHHAAGDFVIKHEPDRLKVKLITVRHYGPLLRMDETAHGPSQNDHAMAALVLFFLTLSIRMRLDRLDGISDVVWADDTAVIGIWTGFLEGLSGNRFPFPSDPVAQFERHLSTYSIADLHDLAETLVARLSVSSDERAVVETNIGRHMEVLCDTIGQIGFP